MRQRGEIMRVAVVFFIAVCIVVGSVFPARADDTELFIVQNSPDGLIVLDLSGSMRWTPPGSMLYVSGTDCSIDGPFHGSSGVGHTYACSDLSQTTGPKYSNEACTGPFYRSSGAGHTVNCSRVAITKRVIFDLLDDNNDNKINNQDEKTLGIRLGYMRFYNCGDDTGNDYDSGCNRLMKPLNTSYSDVWSAVSSETGTGATALVSALNESRLYLDTTKATDQAADCRYKFVILVTDGEDTLSCAGTGFANQPDDYKRRRETVAKAKALTEAGYKVFVVGFGGTMPHYLKNTLNWTALYGGTDNSLAVNSGNPVGYNPNGVTNCQESPTGSHDLGEGLHFYASAQDPGEASLSGYAFFAESASELADSLSLIMRYIQEKAYSFTSPTIPLVRIIGEEVGYTSSFIPNETPFWKGNIKAYRLHRDGTLPVDKDGNPLDSALLWDAFENLKTLSQAHRTIYTAINGSLKTFDQANVKKDDLEVTENTEAEKLVNHVRGLDSYDINLNGDTSEPRARKLGDIFHSNPVIVGEPSRFYEDGGVSGPGGFYESNKNRTKVILVGANDGMHHAFEAETGNEKWAFIPASTLKNLKLMISAHSYYVDASPKVADVWMPSGPGDTTKSADEWKTVLICGLRKGGRH